MSGVIISARGKVGLVSGLSWHTLIAPKGAGRKKEIAQQVKDIGAKSILVHESEVATTLGMYVPNEAEVEIGIPASAPNDQDESAPEATEAPKPTKLHSLAAAFAKLMGMSSAVLIFELDDGRAAVVALQAGRPVYDGVSTQEEAQQQANRWSIGSQVFTNSPMAFRGQEIDDESLWGALDSSTALVAPPINLIAMVLAVSLLAAAVGSWFAYESWSKEREKAARIAAQKAADPRPRYFAALSGSIQELGANRDSLLAGLGAVAQQRTYVAGWALRDVSCSVRARECVWTWERDTGTTQELTQALRPAGYVYRDEGLIDVAVFSTAFEVAQAGLEDRSNLVEMSQAVASGTYAIQNWMNAGIPAPSLVPYAIWPVVPGIDMKRLPAQGTAKSRGLSLTMPLGFAPDVIKSASDDVWWSDFKILIANGDPTITLLGASYVQ